MAYKSLTTPTMVTITGAWLDKEHERPLIDALPQAGPLLAGVEKAHKGLLHTQSADDKAAGDVSVLQQKQDDLDTRHDRKARGVYGALTAFADLAEKPEDAAAYIALRDRIYPQGLKVVQWSYTDEAGEAKLLETRLTQADKDLLKQLPVPGGTLAEEHRARIKAAKELGELETKKVTLAQSSGNAGAVVTGADVVRARNAWIRAITAFVAVLDMEENLDDADRQRILGPLREAERKADRRGKGAEATEPEATETPEAPGKPPEKKPE